MPGPGAKELAETRLLEGFEGADLGRPFAPFGVLEDEASLRKFVPGPRRRRRRASPANEVDEGCLRRGPRRQDAHARPLDAAVLVAFERVRFTRDRKADLGGVFHDAARER